MKLKIASLVIQPIKIIIIKLTIVVEKQSQKEEVFFKALLDLRHKKHFIILQHRVGMNVSKENNGTIIEQGIQVSSVVSFPAFITL